MTDQGVQPRSPNGYLYGLAAAAAFVLMVSLVKICREAEITTRSIVFYRSFIVLPCCFFLCRRYSLRVKAKGFLVMRCLFGFAAMATSFAAMRWISVVEINLLFNLQPVLVAACAPLILGALERPNKLTLIALIAALFGSAVIVTPELFGDTRDVNSYRWLGLSLGAFGALCGALAHVALRGLQETPAIVTVTWFQVCVATLALIPFDGQALVHLSVTQSATFALVGVGLCAFVGQLCLTRAYQLLPAVNASALGYSTPLFGIALDLSVFGVIPELHTFFGGSLIVASGLWWVQRSRASTDAKTTSLHESGSS